MKILTKIFYLKISFISCLFFSAHCHAYYDCSNSYQWHESGAFDQHEVVRFNGHAYIALWWSQGHRPDLYSQQWEEWKHLGACKPEVRVTCDFNNDGVLDSASGFPGADLVGGETVFDETKKVFHRFMEGFIGSGEVTVTYSVHSADQLADAVWNQTKLGFFNRAAPGAHFGESLSVGDFNNDGFCDLAISAPGFSDNMEVAERNKGIVNILYGSPTGLTTIVMGDDGQPSNPLAGQRFDQQTTGVSETAEPGDKFGAAIAVGDFNRDGYDDLAIGVPGESFSEVGLPVVKNAGYFHIIFGSRHGLQTSLPKSVGYFQYISGFPFPETKANDTFGFTIVAADFNKDGYTDLVVAAPGEDGNKGKITVFEGASVGIDTEHRINVTEDNLIAGSAASGDMFGKIMRIGNYNSDGFPDLMIDVPNNANGKGSSYYIPGSASGLLISHAIEKKW